jgi:hypothetical protein
MLEFTRTEGQTLHKYVDRFTASFRSEVAEPLA